MSTIEPTEEQRAAVWRMWMRTSDNDNETVRDIAQLLAEREAKLREEMAELSRGWRADEYELERIRAVLTETQAENDDAKADAPAFESEHFHVGGGAAADDGAVCKVHDTEGGEG